MDKFVPRFRELQTSIGSLLGIPTIQFKQALAKANTKSGGYSLIQSLVSGQLSLSTLNDKQRAEVARSSARTSPIETIESIAIFKLKDKKAYEDIGQIVVDKNPGALAANIERLGQLKITVYIEFANKIGKTKPIHLSTFVRNSLPLISNVEDRFKLLKAVTLYSGEAVADNINISGIADELKRFELAVLSAAKDAKATANKIKRFNITSDIRRAGLFLVAYSKDPKGVHDNAKEFGLQTNLIPDFLQQVEMISKKNGLSIPVF